MKLLLTLALLSTGQTVEARYQNGDGLHVTLTQPSIELTTPYGKLTIPFEHIRKIEVGTHHTNLTTQINALSSPIHKEREAATRALADAGPVAYPALRAASTPDAESKQRIAGLLRRIEELHTDAGKRRADDVVYTAETRYVGKLSSPTLAAKSPHFGELALKLADLRAVLVRGNTETALTIPADDGWHDTGVNVDQQTRLLVLAEGQVDLWPQNLGQYVTNPKGYTTAGKGGTHMAGALLGRVGEHGTAFVLGERYDGTPAGEGRLWVQVVPSPWNNPSAGSYRVRVNVEGR